MEYEISESHLREGIQLERSLKMLPYVGFPLLQACPLRCIYCGVGAEAAASTVAVAEVAKLRVWTETCTALGIRKFRLTGGEPLLHPNIAEIVTYFSHIPANCTLNTAAFLITRKKQVFENLGSSLQMICSLDSLDEWKFNRITGSQRWFKPTIEGIRFMAEIGRLKRINMMVVKENVDEILQMVDFCATLKCNLKVSDIAKAPCAFRDWGASYVELNQIESLLSSVATEVGDHPYTQRYGIPSRIYTVNGVEVTVKSSVKGTTYALTGPCRSCSHYPCEEGMYFINVLPDGTLSSCRPNGFMISSSGNFTSDLNMIEVFESTERISRSETGKSNGPLRILNPVAGPKGGCGLEEPRSVSEIRRNESGVTT